MWGESGWWAGLRFGYLLTAALRVGGWLAHVGWTLVVSRDLGFAMCICVRVLTVMNARACEVGEMWGLEQGRASAAP